MHHDAIIEKFAIYNPNLMYTGPIDYDLIHGNMPTALTSFEWYKIKYR